MAEFASRRHFWKYTHRIHICYIWSHLPSIYPFYVSIYTSTMDPSWDMTLEVLRPQKPVLANSGPKGVVAEDFFAVPRIPEDSMSEDKQRRCFYGQEFCSSADGWFGFNMFQHATSYIGPKNHQISTGIAGIIFNELVHVVQFAPPFFSSPVGECLWNA